MIVALDSAKTWYFNIMWEFDIFLLALWAHYFLVWNVYHWKSTHNHLCLNIWSFESIYFYFIVCSLEVNGQCSVLIAMRNFTTGSCLYGVSDKVVLALQSYTFFSQSSHNVRRILLTLWLTISDDIGILLTIPSQFGDYRKKEFFRKVNRSMEKHHKNINFCSI